MKFIPAIQLALAIEMAAMIPSTTARIGGVTVPETSSNHNDHSEQQEEQGHRELLTALTLTPIPKPNPVDISTPSGVHHWNTGTSGQAICGVTSTFDPTTTDRTFKLKLCTMAGTRNFQPAFLSDAPAGSTFATNCPKDHFLAGINANWDPTQQDRSYQFFCAVFKPATVLTKCKTTTNFVKGFEQDFNWDAPANSLVTGVTSQFDATKHDRIFKFTTCEPFY